MPDFHQSGAITTLHRLGEPGVERLERELLHYSRTRPVALVLPCLFAELRGPALKRMIDVLAGVAYLRHTRIGADGQKGGSATPMAIAAADTTGINGFQFKGVGAPDNQDSDWNGDDGGPLNQLWDTHTTQIEQYIFSVPPLPMAVGDAAYTVNYFSPADCVRLITAALEAQ